MFDMTSAKTVIVAGILAMIAGAGMEKGAAQNPIGNWGGDHIGLEVTDKGLRADFDCAHGAVDTPLTFDSDGRFEAKGSYVQESPGPEREGQQPPPKAARYSGRIQGATMTLTITLADPARTIGPFTLTKDRVPRITKCA